MIFIFNDYESYIQVQSSYPRNTNVSIIKPSQFDKYIPPTDSYERDDPVLHINSQMISPLIDVNTTNLINHLNGTFEQSDNKKIQKKYNNYYTNHSKTIRPLSGYLMRPIEIDSSPSNNNNNKAYITIPQSQSYSKYLQYVDEIK
jgi:hypothetical protein